MRFLAPLLLVCLLFCVREKAPLEERPVRITPPPAKTKPRVDDACMQRCMTRNAMRSVGADQIQYDCELDCRIK